ncbi:hypothetical protein AWZ03_007814 [Drosophila navojoa]|uniref:Uncharacterized protein n=1 Tax=Drosophila navojoa TaxID=7232 RepID=A0A484BCP7_DRONA|nr:hypothetical protein AWZ03_007814 [Drosophila navojoa]
MSASPSGQKVFFLAMPEHAIYLTINCINIIINLLISQIQIIIIISISGSSSSKNIIIIIIIISMCRNSQVELPLPLPLPLPPTNPGWSQRYNLSTVQKMSQPNLMLPKPIYQPQNMLNAAQIFGLVYCKPLSTTASPSSSSSSSSSWLGTNLMCCRRQLRN